MGVLERRPAGSSGLSAFCWDSGFFFTSTIGIFFSINLSQIWIVTSLKYFIAFILSLKVLRTCFSSSVEQTVLLLLLCLEIFFIDYVVPDDDFLLLGKYTSSCQKILRYLQFFDCVGFEAQSSNWITSAKQMSSLIVWDAIDGVVQRACTYEVDHMCRPRKFFNENSKGYAVQISGLLKTPI